MSSEVKQDAVDNNTNKKRKKRSIDFIVENESKRDVKTAGVQRWLQEKELMNKMFNDPNFKSISSHSRLKKEMTEASSQAIMIDWLSSKFNIQILENQGDDCLIIDICSGKGFFGVLISHILPKSNIILMDKNKKINIKHFDSCSNVTFNIVDIRAFKFSLSQWIRNEFNKYKTKNKLILFGTHLCGELSQVVIDAFNELQDIGWCLFLIPCCFPKKDKIVHKAKELEMDTMDYWLKILQDQVKRTKDDNLLLECIEINEMLSEKNHLIRMVRENMHCHENDAIKNKVNDNDIVENNMSFKKSNELEYEPPLKKQKLST